MTNFRISLRFLLLFLVIFALIIFPYPKPQPTSAIGEALTINAPVTLGTGYSFTAGSFVDSSDPNYKLIPAGTSVFNVGSFKGAFTIGDNIADTVTVNSGAWTLANDTNLTLSGGVNGLSFDTSTLTIDATNDRVGIGTTAPALILEANYSGANRTADIARFMHTNLTQGVGIGYNQIALVGTGGNNPLYIDAQGSGNLLLQTTATGNVGIGTANPGGYKLSVVGTGSVLTGSNNLNIWTNSGTAGQGLVLGYNTEAGTGGVFGGDATGGQVNNLAIVGYNGSAWGEVMRIKGNGTVGIGTTAPASLLSVGGVGSVNYAISGISSTANGIYGYTTANSSVGVLGSSSGTGSYGVYADAPSGYAIYSYRGTNYFGSRVGIGIAPNAKWALNVESQYSDDWTAVVNSTPGSNYGLYSRGSSWAGYFSGPLYVSGVATIGTDTPAANYQLTVSGPTYGISATGGSYGVVGSGTYGVLGYGTYAVYGASASYAGYFAGPVYIQTSNNTNDRETLCISAGGSGIITSDAAGNNCDTSSRRYKHDINYLNLNGLDLLNKMQPASFVYNDGEQSEKWGFIAEDMAAIDTHLAAYTKEGLPNSINKWAIMGVIVESVKEQQVEIKELKKEIDELKKAVEELKKK